ncbi:tetratricopeptide repeat protein [Dyadobacter sp. CY323]|uniref:tetratricopeptide repeat protein n=1 Tax=Dyadobacter sp. CY323 TaxID=2907302 RepID=UPI001F46B71C|nr:tetratricopeptide repeat protein [Dyadobacter sp. CY323]MCE6989755.1 tetratricopeptide repeat protein [Dyadobacter sp. CY323]
MLSISELFSLTKSLTKSEKRYFRMCQNFQEGDKGYMKMYDLLEAADIDDADLLKTIHAALGTATVEPARKHLSKVLTRSLSEFDGDKAVENQLWSLYQNSNTLYKKGLYAAAMRIINKAEKLAVEHEKHLFLHILNKKKIEYMMHQQFVDWNESELVLAQEKSRDAIATEHAIQQHASLYEILLCRYWKNGTIRSTREQTLLNDLILEEHLTITNSKHTSFESDITHLHFQSVFFLVTGDVEGSLQIFYELDNLYQAEPKSWINSPHYYIQFLNGILQTLRRVEKFDKMAFFLDRLRSLNNISEYQNLRIRYQVFEHELHILIAKQQISDIPSFLASLPSENEKQFMLTPYQDKAQWWFTLARAYFETGHYDKALHHINRILNNNNDAINNLQYVTYRILKLMVHFHLGDHDYLNYEMRSIERKLKKANQLYRTEKYVISLLRKEMNFKSVSILKEELVNLKNDPYEQHIITELALIPWFNKRFSKLA